MIENAARFSGRVAEYERYRERYDPEVVLPPLRAWCGLPPEWLVADIGAGTGMLADVFLANGNRVLAVEPNEQMRAACAESHKGDGRLTLIDGTAEATGLPDASVEMVSVGRALHWFDVERAFAEFRRVLKPEGWVAVVAFGRDDAGREENVVYEQLMERLMVSRERKKSYRAYARMEDMFAGGEFHHAEVRGEMTLGWDQLLGLAVSLSHAPLPGSSGYLAFEAALREFFRQYAVAGSVTLGTRYWINVGRWVS